MLTNGIATFTLNNASVGDHRYSVVYSGDGNSLGSSATLSHTITKGFSTVQLTADANPATIGQFVTFKVSVAPANATGSVTFSGFDGDGTCVVALKDGQAVCGSQINHTQAITATYSGDSNYLGSSFTIIVDIKQQE
jgi:hypothetical protein